MIRLVRLQEAHEVVIEFFVTDAKIRPGRHDMITFSKAQTCRTQSVFVTSGAFPTSCYSRYSLSFVAEKRVINLSIDLTPTHTLSLSHFYSEILLQNPFP